MVIENEFFYWKNGRSIKDVNLINIYRRTESNVEYFVRESEENARGPIGYPRIVI